MDKCLLHTGDRSFLYRNWGWPLLITLICLISWIRKREGERGLCYCCLWKVEKNYHLQMMVFRQGLSVKWRHETVHSMQGTPGSDLAASDVMSVSYGGTLWRFDFHTFYVCAHTHILVCLCMSLCLGQHPSSVALSHLPSSWVSVLSTSSWQQTSKGGQFPKAAVEDQQPDLWKKWEMEAIYFEL